MQMHPFRNALHLHLLLHLHLHLLVRRKIKTYRRQKRVGILVLWKTC